MKKLYYLIILTVILGLVLTGCFLSNVGQVPTSPQSGITYLTKGTEDDPSEIILWAGAGQNINVGTVEVWDDTVELTVKYNVPDPWCITETHLHVACDDNPIPVNRKGNPIPGHFDYGSEHEISENVTVEEFTIPLEDINCCNLDIAAHAVVEQLTDGCADSVYGFDQGTQKDDISVSSERSNATNTLGSAEEHYFFSLGFMGEAVPGGWIILEFEDYVGTCLTVVEQSPGTEYKEGDGYPLEQAKVYVSTESDNPTDWTYLGMANNQIAGGSEAGQSHENVFDLEECIKFVKIVDQTDPTLHGDTADAFDLDAVCGGPCYQEETAWADGVRFVQQGNWATYFQYCMCDPELINGGFELPVLTSSPAWDLVISSEVKWTVNWYDACSNAPADALLELHRNYWKPYEGDQYVELDTDCNPNITREAASVKISQILTTCADWEYTVSFAYSPRPDHDDNALEVYWDGNLEGTYTADGTDNVNTSWTPVELTLIASGSTTELKFVEVGTPDCRGMLLDDVKVER